MNELKCLRRQGTHNVEFLEATLQEVLARLLVAHQNGLGLKRRMNGWMGWMGWMEWMGYIR